MLCSSSHFSPLFWESPHTLWFLFFHSQSQADYFPGGSKTIEPWFFGSLTNDQGEPVDPTPARDADLALNRFIVFRNTMVRSNGGVVVRGTSANVLVEGSVIENSHVGIHVNTTTTKGGIVLLNNTEPPGVKKNFNPYTAPPPHH